ncbi:EcsC family protein [Adlercreutzia caecimuris]|uniref:EcsC family protein n=1 Tax=Adlercreutzia caecimuris TaxID=671266 RepID=UPI00272A3847|nr:EcsC family protein [Adlercreutzia caecimuris]
MSEEQVDVLDDRELAELDQLRSRYEKMTAPGMLAKAGEKIASIIPAPIKEAAENAGGVITEQQFYAEAMKIIATGFKALEAQAARVTVSEKTVVEKTNKLTSGRTIESLDELCFARSYEVAQVANSEKLPSLISSLVEGGATGFFGFAGILPNIITSTFCYYRAVQSIAISYGYDVRNNPDELMIASEVFTTALSPHSDSPGEMASIIGKIMMISEAEAIKQTVKKGWTEMAARGGIALLLTQMRALAHGAAKKALQKAGKEGLENSVFRSVLEQIGKRLGQKAVQRAVPFISAAIGALFDTGEMSRVLDFADTFYHKRFILEKGMRQAEFVSRVEHSQQAIAHMSDN